MVFVCCSVMDGMIRVSLVEILDRILLGSWQDLGQGPDKIWDRTGMAWLRILWYFMLSSGMVLYAVLMDGARQWYVIRYGMAWHGIVCCKAWHDTVRLTRHQIHKVRP